MKAYSCILYLLFLSSAIFAQQSGTPILQWQKCLGGTGYEKGNTAIRALDGNIILGGYASSNDGDVTGKTPGSTQDAWLVKIDLSGNIIWTRCIGGEGEDEIVSIVKASDNGYIALGTNDSRIGIVGNHGYRDIWVIKFDESGNILWNKSYGGSKVEFAGNIKPTSDGGYIIVGNTVSNDGDVSGNNGLSTDPYGSANIWVLNIDKDGNKKWQKCLGDTLHWRGMDIMQVAGNNYLVTGDRRSNIYPFLPQARQYRIDSIGNVIDSSLNTNYESGQAFLPIGGTQTITQVYKQRTPGIQNCSNNNYTGFKISNTAINLMTCTTSGTDRGYYNFGNPANMAISVSAEKNFLVGATNDNHPSLQYHHLATSTLWDAYFGGFDLNGTRFSQRCFGGSKEEEFGAILSISENEFILLGSTQSIDGDVSGQHGTGGIGGTTATGDMWVVKVKVPPSSNSIIGNVFIDYNLNGIKDGNEPFYKQTYVTSSKQGSSYSTYTVDGKFSNVIDTGTYTTTVTLTSPYYTPLPVNKQSVFNTYGNIDSVFFALQPVAGKKDLQTNLIPLTPARPGFEASYKLLYRNAGTVPLATADIRFVKDSRVTYVSSFPTYTSISGDTLSWSIANLEPGDSGSVLLVLRIKTPPEVASGDTLQFTSTINPVIGDETPLNNVIVLKQIVTGSFDPNDKTENNAGKFTQQQLADRESLTYTIRFQNTGNDTAFTVIVRDTMSLKLDSATLEMVAVSHPYQLSIKDNKYYTWTFNNILLPDSNRNKPLSHGFISYRIKPKIGLQLGDTVRNSASIYFDFNLPVKTNTQTTIITTTPAVVIPQPQVSGLMTNYCNNLGIQKGKINNLPASASGITVTVKLDNTSLSVASDSTFSFDVNPLSVANHTITVSYSKGSDIKTFTHVFSIVAAITPDVNVNANITNITNLTTPVIVTGTNAAGGGTAPLYSFAKDRAFTTILQAEGISNTLTIDPSTLTLGDNWIFIRMKSNAACITSQIAIDSIKLVRDMMTGITDPDNPGKVISLYPNPFNKQVYISGLSSGKSYKITLTNLNGQLIQQSRISNRTNVELLLPISKAGTYLLTIYDEKKKQLLGTIQVVKQ